MVESFDVAIAGGGPAGAAAALMLARAGRSVLLADSAPANTFRVGEGLPPTAHSLLQELGVLKRFQTDEHRISHGNVSVWGSNVPRSVDFMFHANRHGYQLDRSRFDAMLKNAASEAGAVMCDESRLQIRRQAEATTSCQSGQSGRPMQLRLSTHSGTRDIECRWLIHAGGRSAAIARSHGVARQKTDRLIAIYTLLQTDSKSDRDGRTMIEAGEDGWWYSVLLPSGDRLLVYLCDHELNPVARTALLSSDLFSARFSATTYLNQLCQSHGYLPKCMPRGVDASSGRLTRFGGDAWIAVGDAALSFDPLSSQGISNALYTGMAGARAVDAALDGHLDALAHYQNHLTEIYDAYLRNRATFYGMERRWAKREFWQRRHVD